MSTYRCRVFEKDGNRFLVPGVWHPADESSVDVLCNALMFSCVLGADEAEWIDVEVKDDGTADLEHIPTRVAGRQFAHGAMDVLLLSGPLFDEHKAAKP